MNIEKEAQQTKYFEYRNIDNSDYETTMLPLWITAELENKDMRILDYGCGLGQILQALMAEGYKNFYGVDIEKSAIECCKEKNLHVEELNLEKLENPYGFKFDVIILSHIIEHILKDEIINTLSFIKNEFLADKGKLLIAVPNAQSNTNAYWAYEDWTHTTLFTSGSLYYVLKAAGFNTIEFLDIDCTLGSRGVKKVIRKILLKIYILNMNFWNKVTCSAYHKPSQQIFSYEIKCKAN